MKIEDFVTLLNMDFYAGVPDSLLIPLCDFLMDQYGISENHIIAANEGNAVALAAGYHLATGKTPVVYLQNSGLGNIINPVASLMHEKVFGIPCLFIVGWRGEPGVHDEPQHRFQGEITLPLMEELGISTFVIQKDTEYAQIRDKLKAFHMLFQQGRQAAFIVRKGALSCQGKAVCGNAYTLRREEAIRQILIASGDDPIVATTGKISREVYELREAMGQGHGHDFLTVGSMGHSSSVAMGVALQKPGQRVWCLDGDGAALMHLGAMALIGANKPVNLVHIVLNNEAHESVGGMPTVAGKIDLPGIARSCGYPSVVSVKNLEGLAKALEEDKTRNQLSFIEVCCALGSRKGLGRPAITPVENKKAFMDLLR